MGSFTTVKIKTYYPNIVVLVSKAVYSQAEKQTLAVDKANVLDFILLSIFENRSIRTVASNCNKPSKSSFNSYAASWHLHILLAVFNRWKLLYEQILKWTVGIVRTRQHFKYQQNNSVVFKMDLLVETVHGVKFATWDFHRFGTT